jgi:hypothetical protein
MKLLPQTVDKDRLILTHDERAKLSAALSSAIVFMGEPTILRELYDTIKLPEPVRNDPPLDEQEKAVLDQMFEAVADNECDTCYYYGSVEMYDMLGDHEIARLITPHINAGHRLLDWDITLYDGPVITVEANTEDEARQVYADHFGDYKSITEITPKGIAE